MSYIFVSQMTSRKWSTDCKETKMKIDPNRLRALRQRKKLSRPDLERVSGITVRTIQRLENEPDECKTTREDTVIRLAKALNVEPGVLTGELDMPDADKVPVVEADPVRVGAQIPPKVRLAYDLIKRRYGVNTTELINMAPLFFSLLAEGSLAWRLRKLEEAKEASGQLNQIDGYWRGGLGTGLDDAVYHGIAREEESIRKADLFGKRLLDDPDNILVDRNFFDLSEENPFADYLRKLAADLNIPESVTVDDGELDYRLEFRFPYYGICDDELNEIANRSPIGRAALESSLVGLSEIPKKLIAEENGEERQKWLEDRMSEKFGGMNEEELADFLKKLAPVLVSSKTKKMLEENESGMSRPETVEEGDDQ